ncbi:hypothetical protein JOF41_007355 [Saccharothrix coeruleofusca]|uniref:hypothetical protein n=1 Tax=Saccharothrix coeruleofusca TaxID=33919 RepID=UPI001AE22910|nr:hypothetical protein [Saccharothrix coeruleofusca]MBP2341101.1 hypothetical protein [Saccharothrix coeruleofusca]
MSTDETGLRCRRGEQCGDARREPAWATVPGGLCQFDTTTVKRAIQQLPRDYLELGHLLSKTGRTTDAPTGGTRELPVPLRLGVLTLQEDLVFEAGLWASAVGDHADVGSPDRRLRRAVELLLADWPALLHVPVMDVARLDGRDERLSGRSPVVLGEEDGVDGALRLLELHERVALVEGRTHRAHRLWSPCPKCQALALVREEGSGQVDCRCCHYREPLESYEARADVLAKAYERSAA